MAKQRPVSRKSAKIVETQYFPSDALMMRGKPGDFVTMRNSYDYIQWKYNTGTVWYNLIATSDLVGTAADMLNMTVTNGSFAYNHVGDTTWSTLIAISDIVTAHTHTDLIYTSNSSLFRHTTADSQIVFTSAATSLAQRTHVHGNISFDLSNLSGTYSSASSGLTISMTAGDANGMALKGSGAYSQNTGTVEFHNANSITFGMTNNLMTASADFAQTNHTHSDLYIALSASTDYATSYLSNTFMHTSYSSAFASSELSKTFATTGHTHAYAGTSVSSALSSGSDYTVQLNSLGMTFIAPTVITNNVLLSVGGTNTLGTAALMSTGTAILYGGNNVTLSQENNSVTFIAGSMASQTYNTTDYSFSNLGSSVHTDGVPYGLSLTHSGPVDIAITGSNTTGTTAPITSGTLSLSAGNNITLGQTGNLIEIKGEGVSDGIIGIAIKDVFETATFTSGTVYFSAQSNIELNTYLDGASQFIRFQIPDFAGTTTAGTNVGLTVNSLGIRASIDTAGMSSFGDGYNYIAADTLTAASKGEVIFASSNGLFFGMSTAPGISSSTITASYSQSTHEHPYIASESTSVFGYTSNSSLLQHTSATSAITSNAVNTSVTSQWLTTAALSNHSHGNVSLSLSNLTGTYSSASNGFTLSLTNTFTAGGGGNWELEGTNTQGTTATSFTTLFLEGYSNVTLSGSSNTVRFIVADAAGQTYQPVAFSGSNTSTTASTMSFGNSNDLSFYVTNGSLVGSFSQSTHSHQTYAATDHTHGLLSLSLSNLTGTYSSASSGLTLSLTGSIGTVDFADSNGISFGSTTSGATTTVITATVRTNYAGSNLSISSGYAGSQLSASVNTSGITLSVPAWITTAGDAVAASWELEGVNTAGTTSSSFSRLYLEGYSNVTLSGSSNTIRFSVADAAGQTYQPVAYSGSNASSTASTLVFGNSNNLSHYITNGSVVASFSESTHAHSFVNQINGSSGSISLNTGSSLSSSANASGITLGLASNISTAWSGQTTANQSRVVQINGSSGSISFNTASSLSSSANASGITFGLASNITTALQSYNANYLTSQSSEPRVVSLNGSSGTISLSASTNITISNDNGTIKFIGPSGVSGSWELEGANTAGTTGSQFQTLFLSGGQNVTLEGNSNTIIFNVNATGAQDGGNVIAVSGSTASSTGTIAFWNANGLTFGMSDSTRVTASYNSTQFAFASDQGDVYFNDSYGISFGSTTGLSSTTITASYRQDYYLLGTNTAGSTSLSGGSVMSLSGGDNITLSVNTNSQLVIVGGGGAVGELSFSNTNGVTFGTAINGTSTTVTASVSTAYIPLANSTKFPQVWQLTGNTSGTTSSGNFLSSSILRLAGGNNITLSGNSDGVITIVGPSAGTGAVNISGSNTSSSFNTILFGQSNGVTHYITNGSLVADFGSANFVQTSQTGSVYFQSSNGISFGSTTGLSSTSITASYVQNHYFLGNTGGSSSLSGGSNLSLSAGDNITLSVNTDRQIVINAGGGGGGSVNFSAGTTSNTLTNVVFSNSNNLSFGLNGSTITATASYPQGSVYFSDSNGVSFGSNAGGSSTTITATFGQMYYLSGANTAGSSTFSGGSAVTLSGGNNITLSVNTNSQLVISAGAGGGGIAASIGGNSTSGGAGYSNITSGTMHLRGGNNITLSQDGASITISGANLGGAQTGISGLGNSQTTYSSGTVLLSAYSNITISSSLNGASQYFRFSVADQSSQSRVLQINGSSGSISFNTGSSLSSSANASGITFGLASNISTAWSNMRVYYDDGTTFITSGSVRLQGTNITPSITYDAGGFHTFHFSVAAPGAAAENNWFHLTGNTASNSTASGSTIVLSAGNNITLAGTNNSVIQIIGNQASLSFSNGSGVSFGTAGAGSTTTITASVETGYVQTQSSSVFVQRYSLSESGGSISGSTTGTIGSYLKIGAGSNITLSGNTNGITIFGTSGGGAVGELSFSNANGVSFGTAVNGTSTTVTASVSTAYIPLANSTLIPQVWQISGNTANSSSSSAWVSSSIMRLYASDNITLSGGSAGITIIGGGGVGGGVAIADADSTVTNNTVVFSNANGITFNLNGSTMTAQHNAYSATSMFSASFLNTGEAHIRQIAASNSSYTSGSIVFSGSNNVTVSYNASTIIISGANTHAQQTGISQIAASNTTYTSGSVFFSASRNLSLSYNGSTISHYGPASVLYAMSVGGNTGTTGSSNISNAGFVLAGGNNVTLSQSNNTISIHGGGGGGVAGIANSQTTYTSGTIYLSENGNVTINSSVNGASQYYRISAGGGGGLAALGETANSSAFTSGSVMLSAVGLTVDSSANGASQYLRISAPALGYLYFSNANGHSWSSSTSGVSTSIYIVTTP